MVKTNSVYRRQDTSKLLYQQILHHKEHLEIQMAKLCSRGKLLVEKIVRLLAQFLVKLKLNWQRFVANLHQGLTAPITAFKSERLVMCMCTTL